MPKYKLSTERVKTDKAIKSYQRAGFNQHTMARQEGISQPTVSRKLNRKPVRDALSKMLDSGKTAKKAAKRLDEGLDATKVISAQVIVVKNKPGSLEPETPEVKEKLADEKSVDFIDVPDLSTRHRYLMTYMHATGRIRTNGNGQGNQYIQVIFGHRPVPVAKERDA